MVCNPLEAEEDFVIPCTVLFWFCINTFEALGKEVYCQIDFQNFQAKSELESRLHLHE